MNNLIECLKIFNRKERYHLLRTVNPKAFDLSEEFRCRLKKLLNRDIPTETYVVMDYHLDWIYGAFVRESDALAEKNSRGKRTGEKATNFEFVTGTQEDIDLLIVFRDDIKNIFVVVFLEAKGDMKWDQDQLKSKLSRLNAILVEFDSIDLDAYFLLISPRAHLKISA